jgi:hypothetical protein
MLPVRVRRPRNQALATSAWIGWRPREPRVAVRPEIDDGAAGSERERRRLLDPDGTRAHAPPRDRAARIVRVGATAAARQAKARAWHRERHTLRWRGTRDPAATRARLLDPHGTRAHATPATSGSNGTSERDASGEVGEAASAPRSSHGVSTIR